MPRQKFCSVPGCLSTTDVIKREQEAFLSAYCSRCSVERPCRCPAPDIYTTRRETRTKFASWCNAIGLRSPGYYINVCYKHFSSGCPSRTNPNPDVVRPVWEKHIKDKLSGSSASKKIVVSSTSNTTNNATTAAAAAANNGIRKKKPLTKTVIIKTPSTVMKGRSSSLLREALLLPQRPLPRAYVLQSSSHHNATENRNQIENQSSSENHDRGVLMLLNQSSTALPSNVILPQIPVPLNELTMSSSTLSSSSSSDEIKSVIEDPLNKNYSMELEDFDSFDDSLLLDIIDRRKSQDKDMELSLPALLDQSDDPYLNNQDNNDSLPFTVTEELDNTVQKWMEACHEGAAFI
eukprot:07379.XXX_211065_209821_1 [CDS] Oithona nana genome sequencing.